MRIEPLPIFRKRIIKVKKNGRLPGRKRGPRKGHKLEFANELALAE
jgi:hypothetical protein